MAMLGAPRRKTLHPDKILALHHLLVEKPVKRRRINKARGKPDVGRLAFDLHDRRMRRYLPRQDV